MRRSLAPFTAPEALVHTQSLADSITTTSGFRFSVHTANSRHTISALGRGMSRRRIRCVAVWVLHTAQGGRLPRGVLVADFSVVRQLI